ncbi:DUF6090 family protein [Marinicella litoralis]|uniref:Uncharacterized protein n=1 Tax=Marinicella litoralis TaxID=644220 RepID=A0A4V3DIJ8_9GAMM|nr:DUF6090 family protein [Marinicella litoralis]TDR22351.1 hypothetical protein C8D91_0839 [Marinicella litoralis]
MLLRRITQHVQSQNWFAVFLDFIIVVVGVFIGIQVSNWNETRHAEQEAGLFRANLIADLQNDRDVYALRKKFYLEVKQAITGVDNILHNDLPDSLALQWDFIRDVDKAGGMWPFQPSAQVYNQLLNAGKLDLVSDDAVLRQMRDYYQDAALEAGLTFKFDSVFRDHSRSLLDWQLTDYIISDCNVIGADPSDILDDNQNYYTTCPVPDLASNILQTAAKIHTEKNLINELNLLFSQSVRILSFIEYFDDQAESLIQELERQ